MTPLTWVSKTSLGRHAVCDLSANYQTKELNHEKYPASSGDSNSIRHAVASKRRPSACRSLHFNTSCIPVLSKNESKSESKDSIPSGSYMEPEASEMYDEGSVPLKSTVDDPPPTDAGGSTDPSCPEMFLKPIQQRNCAIYEPIVTHKHYQAVVPAFQKCVEYLQEHSSQLDTLFSSSPSQEPHEGSVGSSEKLEETLRTSSSSEFLQTIKASLSHYKETLRQLDQQDSRLAGSVYAIEKEHNALYQWRHLNTCHTHDDSDTPDANAHPPQEEQVLETLAATVETPVSFSPEKYNERVQNLEALKSCLDQQGEQIALHCQCLDNQIENALKLTLSTIEKGKSNAQVTWDFLNESSISSLL